MTSPPRLTMLPPRVGTVANRLAPGRPRPPQCHHHPLAAAPPRHPPGPSELQTAKGNSRIEKLTLSAADLDRLTLGKADLADLAPPPLCWRHEPQGVAIGLPQLSQDPQGSPVEKGIEFLRPYSLVEIAAILSGLADGAPVDEYELLRRAQLDLLSLPPGRPRIYDDSRSLAEMARLMAEDESLSVNRAATLVAERLTGEHSANSARDRLAKNYRRGQRRIAAAQKSPGQNADLSLMRPADEAVI